MHFTEIYYTDATCEPNKTLEKLEAHGIREIIPVDSMGILAVTRKRATLVGNLCYGELDLKKVIEMIPIQKLLSLTNSQADQIKYEEKTINFMIVPVRDEGKLKVFFVAVNVDQIYNENHLAAVSTIMKIVRENAYLNNEIRHEKNYLVNVLDSSEAIIISANRAEEITTANQAALKFFGTKEMIGGNISELFHYSFGEIISQVIVKNRRVKLKEMVISRKRNQKKIMNISIAPLENSQKHVVGVVLIANDITEKRILQNQFEQLKEFAALGELSAEIAHDIKNPLMTIRGCTRIIQKELNGEHEWEKFLPPIIEEVERINQVVEQMISYRHLLEESINSTVNINELLEKAISIVTFHIGNKKVLFRKKMDEHLPLSYGQNIKLQQAFINIFLNAIQAIEKNGTIVVASKYADNQIVISISDSGIGIMRKELPKIFQPYYTTKQSTRGLGLSIVKRVVHEHKGKIIVNSEINRGTTFQIYLPCHRGDE